MSKTKTKFDQVVKSVSFDKKTNKIVEDLAKTEDYNFSAAVRRCVKTAGPDLIKKAK